MDENEELSAQAEVTAPVPVRRINSAKQTASWRRHLVNKKAKARRARKLAKRQSRKR